MKANWDAIVEGKAKQTGLGVIIQDYKGDVQASLCCNVGVSLHLVLAKAMALPKAMILYTWFKKSMCSLFYILH